MIYDPRKTQLQAICNQVEAVLTSHHAPGHIGGGTWSDERLQLEFEPAPHIRKSMVLSLLPVLSVVLGIPVDGRREGDHVILTLAIPSLRTRELPALPCSTATELAQVEVTNVPLTRPTLLAMLYTTPARSIDMRPSADLDPDWLTILTAQTLQHPVRWTRPLAQMGRFVQVAYEPVQMPDPDLILAMDTGNAAFVAAMRHFQDVRMSRPQWGWTQWYQTVMGAGRGFFEPLLTIGATEREASFVLRWAALVAATGNQG